MSDAAFDRAKICESLTRESGSPNLLESSRTIHWKSHTIIPSPVTVPSAELFRNYLSLVDFKRAILEHSAGKSFPDFTGSSP